MATESIVDKLTHYSELSYILWKKEIKVRYKNNFFGYLWSLANPLSFALVFYFAFNVVFKSGEKNFVLFLISGLFAWQWIANYIIGLVTVLCRYVILLGGFSLESEWADAAEI